MVDVTLSGSSKYRIMRLLETDTESRLPRFIVVIQQEKVIRAAVSTGDTYDAPPEPVAEWMPCGKQLVSKA